MIVTPDGTDRYAESMSFKEARLTFPDCVFAVEKELYNYVVGITLFIDSSDKDEEMYIVTTNTPMAKEEIREELNRANAIMQALSDLWDDFEGNLEGMKKYYPQEAEILTSLDGIPDELRSGYLEGLNISNLMYGVLAFSDRIVRVSHSAEPVWLSLSEELCIEKSDFPVSISGIYCVGIDA